MRLQVRAAGSNTLCNNDNGGFTGSQGKGSDMCTWSVILQGACSLPEGHLHPEHAAHIY